MIQLDISDEEAGTLREVLESAVSDLGYEIGNTDAKDYRDGLKAKQALLRRVLEQLPGG